MLRPESSGLSGPRLQHIDRYLQQNTWIPESCRAR